MDGPSPGRGKPVDSIVAEAFDLLASIGSPSTPESIERTLVALSGASERAWSAVEQGQIDARRASELVRRSQVLHRLLKYRLDARLQPNLEAELEAAAKALCVDVGFERVLAGRVGETTLEIVTTRFVEEPEWRDAVHAAAAADPPQLDLAVRESAVIVGQHTALISDPQYDPGTWKPVVLPLRTESYVSAPVVVGGQTVATLHADCWFSGRTMSETDRDILGLFADELSFRLGVADQRSQSLTAQQLAVMELVAAGYTNSEIAQRLYLSSETVKSHLGNVYERLGVSDRSSAVAALYDV